MTPTDPPNSQVLPNRSPDQGPTPVRTLIPAHGGLRPCVMALDTSTEFCSVALMVLDDFSRPADAASITVRHEATGAVSSTRILPAMRELLQEAGLTMNDVGLFAFGAGPGSFTGLRSAVGVVQGLAYGLRIPVAPVSTLMACAEAARIHRPETQRVVAALDARMDQVYWGEYLWDPALGDWSTVNPAALDAPEAVPRPASPATYVLAGNAATAFGPRLAVGAAASAIDPLALPHALPVALLGWRAWRAGRGVAAAAAAPIYIRNNVAQTIAERRLLRGEAAR